ncbi:MAG TPA: substrate-binding domain-containing protein [Treponemataceae bacterium]|nr:substrate-binding domain-containing protein [Treponemataceae bacterium]
MTIGLVADSFNEISVYQEAVWRGVSDAAHELGIQIRTYVGGALEYSPLNPFEKTKNIAYEFLDPQLLDGIVYCGGTLGNGVAKEKFDSFCKRYSAIPSISVGPAGTTTPRILVDNDTGMKDMVVHLIEDHGYAPIAFISGPAGNADADRRKKMFVETMREHGQNVDAKLLYEGDFNSQSGIDAVAYWFDTLGLAPRAIVASNDNMAFGVLSALQERGISVPYAVAVTGFDDVESAAMTLPPLTTVSQPIYQEAKRALFMLVDAIKGEPLPFETLEPAVQVLRQSCGCYSDNVNSFTESLSGASDSVERDVFTLVGMDRDDPSAGILIDLMAQISDEFCNEQDFLKLLSELLRRDILSGARIGRWYYAINRFRFAITGRANLLHRCQAMISDAEQQQIFMKMNAKRQQLDLLMSAERELITSFKMENLVEVMRNSFTRLGMNGVVLCIYDNPDNPLQSAHVATAFKNGKFIPYPEQSFSPTELVPAGVDYLGNSESSILIEPVYYREDQIGYLVFEQTVPSAVLYESLAAEVSSALEGAILIDRVTSAEKQLEERNREIEALVRPMLDSIKSITNVATEQQQAIGELEELNQRSIRAAADMASNTGALTEALQKTGELVSGIDDITEVINVVAINASIQAAHVGKEGAGFAVIAGEVRKLAQSTRKNSSEITGFLTDVDNKISGLTNSNKDLTESFSQLRETIQNTVQTLETIAAKMEDMDRGSNEILKIMNR